jgi:xanthine dehydrogenase YagR molybdenum-binding subunit
VAPAIGVAAADITASGGRVHSKTTPGKGLSWADACKRLQTTPVSVNAGWEPGLSASGSSGVQFAEVSVDIETGIAKVDRILCVQDCGLIVNQLTAESQCIGGMVMGVGYALYEDRILDRNTAMQVNPNMEWYLVPGMSDIPKIDVMLMNQPERGVIGIGEPPTISTAAAIANAVANAIGVRVRSIPLTPQKVLTALEGERAGGTQ